MLCVCGVAWFGRRVCGVWAGAGRSGFARRSATGAAVVKTSPAAAPRGRRACTAALRNGLLSPRCRHVAISSSRMFMARTRRLSQRARRRCTSSIYGRIEEFADAGWCISYEQGDLQPSLLIECRRVVPSVSMTVALGQLAKTSWRSQHVVYGRTGDPKIGVIATGLRQVSQPKLDLRLNTTPQSISMDRCR